MFTDHQRIMLSINARRESVADANRKVIDAQAAHDSAFEAYQKLAPPKDKDGHYPDFDLREMDSKRDTWIDRVHDLNHARNILIIRQSELINALDKLDNESAQIADHLLEPCHTDVDVDFSKKLLR